MATPSESTSGGGGGGSVIILSRPSRSSGGGGRRGRRGQPPPAVTSTSTASSIDIISAPSTAVGGVGDEKVDTAICNTIPSSSHSSDTLETGESSSTTVMSLAHEESESVDDLLGAPAIIGANFSVPGTSMTEPAVTIFSAPTSRPGRRRGQQQQQQPQTRRSSLHRVPASRQKAVSFQPEDEGLFSVREITAVSDMSPEEIAMVWYSEEDLDDMQDDVADVLEMLATSDTSNIAATNDSDSDGHDDSPDSRGLEGMRTPSERQELQAARELNWDAVLDEQDRQWDVIDELGGCDEWGERFDGCQLMDPEKMGVMARKSSQKCVKIARELGKSDAEFVRNMLTQETGAAERMKMPGIGELESEASKIVGEEPARSPPPQLSWPLPGPPSNRHAARAVSSGECADGTASRRGGGIRTGAARAALRQQRRTRQSFHHQPVLPSRPPNQPLRRIRSGSDVPDSLNDMVCALQSRSSATPRSSDCSRSRCDNAGTRSENKSEKSTNTSKTRSRRNNTLQDLRSARQMERVGESRRVLAKGGSFRGAPPASGDVSPRRISVEAASNRVIDSQTKLKQEESDIANRSKRKVRKGRLRKPKSRAENIKKLLGSSSDADKNAKDTVPSPHKGMTHLLKGKDKRTSSNANKRGAYDFAPLAA